MKQFIDNLPKKHKLGIGAVGACILLLVLMPGEKASASRNTPALEVGKLYPIELEIDAQSEEQIYVPFPELADSEQNQSPANEKWRKQQMRVKKGDNLAKLFNRAGFSAQTLYKVSQSKHGKRLTQIHPGEELTFYSDSQGQLQRLIYPLSDTDTLVISYSDKGFQGEKQVKEVEIRTHFANASINTNFWSAGLEAGLNNSQIMNLANIFGWDIDFVQDIRKGDEFHVYYEKRYIDGEFVSTGNILAAEFVNQGERFTAIRFEDGEYYSPEGRSMRKTFLRAPVSFKYVSSNFNPRRLHPVTGKVRPHRGIDYAANWGTPVMAAGNGKVVKSGRNRLNGNYVFIEHGNGIVTKYLYLSKRKVKRGQRVKQGQIIGNVGKTGRVTGTHLHYEFIVNGVHRNPRTVKLPKPTPIKKSKKAAFSKHAVEVLAMLESNKRAVLVMK